MTRKKVGKIPKKWKPVFGIRPIRKGQNRMVKSKVLNVEVSEQFFQELKDGEMETIIIRLRLVRQG